MAFYPLVENHHSEGILRFSLAPAPNVSAEIQASAEDYAMRVMSELEYVGVLAIEFFETPDGLVANEMAVEAPVPVRANAERDLLYAQRLENVDDFGKHIEQP